MRIRFIPLEKLPHTDTCWSLIEGPDDRAYIAGCSEHMPGGTVFLARYNPRTEELEYLLDVADAVGNPPSDGRATQCKIHYSMVVDDDGVLYGATHLSGPAFTEVRYNPWASFDDPIRSFVGARLFAYDTGREEVLWVDTLIPWEGCRCLALDRKRRLLYAVGYPRNHMYCYDMKSRRRVDLGRIGSVNPQAIWLDGQMRPYTTDDYGRLLTCDPAAPRLVETDILMPHAPYQNGWHNVPYDVVGVPGSDDVVGASWNQDPYMFRFSPGVALGTGTMRDLGATLPGFNGEELRSMNAGHSGGFVFAANGEVIYGVSGSGKEGGNWRGHAAMIRRMNVGTGEARDLCPLVDEKGVEIGYVSRAVRIGAEHLILGAVGPKPTGIVHITLDGELTKGPYTQTPRRYWG